MNLLLAACLVAALPNTDFTTGDASPTGWTLSGGQGRWVDRQVLEVTGDGKSSNHWSCDCRLEPGKLYRFEMRARGTTGDGCVIAGPEEVNRDFRVSPQWQDYGYVFRVPDGVEKTRVRLGQWEAKGKVEFDRVRLTPVLPASGQYAALSLGEGEILVGNNYTFTATFAGPASNYHRPLHSVTARFNTDRWVIADGNQVTYRFELPECKIRLKQLTFNICHHTHGECVLEISSDGRQWERVASRGSKGTAQAVLPASPAPSLQWFVRLRGISRECWLQVDQIMLKAEVAGNPPPGVGQTLFAELAEPAGDVAFERLWTTGLPAESPILQAMVVNRGNRVVGNLKLTAENSPATVGRPKVECATQELKPGSNALVAVRLQGSPGENRLTLAVGGSQGPGATATVHYRVPEFYRSDYGEALGNGGSPLVWWCPATHKVPRSHEPAKRGAKCVPLAAARNDREAVQIVLKSGDRPLENLTAQAGDFHGPKGAAIPAQAVQILRVAYHFVEHPTDKTGVRDWWPDALPPLRAPITVQPGCNQPLWVLVYVPKDAPPGDYDGTVSLAATGYSAQVPLKLHVWNFTLPDRNHVDTAFGLEPWEIERYHQLKNEPDKRRVWGLYLQAMSEHRISPYDPLPWNPIRVRFRPEAKPPTAEVDSSAFDTAFQQVLDKHHFNTYRLPIQGMGGGTFHERVDPSIGKFAAGTPEYEAMFASQMKQLEDHFREKGWLDIPFIYWFDEPDPKDYQFVRSGMDRLARTAPKLRRMLTEQPEEAMAGPVDIWCPVTPQYDHAAATKRRSHGEHFWWYVCCGPKEPYCTLFIDHPATELRVWLWQTWHRGVDGILVWGVNYWNSDTAFPDPAHPQNPYEDPMGYQSGYGLAKGAKAFWGNGDGRFLYPPEAAAVPGQTGPNPVLAPPVASIRLEMLREGIEDWEYLYLLRELAGNRPEYQSLLEVPPSITRDMTTFTTDPEPIYQRRQQVAEAIERLVTEGKK